MDSPDKIRISLYIDKKLSKDVDKVIKEHGFSSRNEFYSTAAKNFIANEMVENDNGILTDKLARAVANLSEENAKAISKGLFRYAVQLEMVMRIIAEITEIEKSHIEEMRCEAINNVRRTRGKVKFEDIINGHYN